MSFRSDANAIFRAALKAADPAAAVRRFLRREGETLVAGRRRYDLRTYRSIAVLGAGKASVAMAQAVERLLGNRISVGWINTKYGHGSKLPRIYVHECGHPVPDEAGLEGAQRIATIAREATAGDLLIFLISGGASALTPYPVPPITLAGKQRTTQLLLDCGATIHEINALRKHISAFKGGQLARLASPATVITLMLSDVIGDAMDVIGSGPTVPDASSFPDVWRIIEKYKLEERLPRAVRERLEQGRHGTAAETPKLGDTAFERTHNLVVGSNRLAVDAAAAKAKSLGYRVLVLSTLIEGETREIARMHAAIAREIRQSGRPLRPPACLLSGGETTVTIRGGGLGGRNQEFVLAATLDIAGDPGMAVFSGGTDGTDGPTDAAGAIADGRSVARAAQFGLDARGLLDCNDSYHFFEPLGDLVKTGPTGTNVMDVRLLLVR